MNHNQITANTVNYDFNVKIIALITLSVNSGEIFPALRTMMFSSTVKMRKGRMYEFTGSEPEIKSVDINASAKGSLYCWDVIWQRIISSPLRLAITKAGRLLLPVKSEKGKGTTTISPFTNLSMLSLLSDLTNLLPKRFRLQNEFLFYRNFRDFQKLYRPTCEQAPTTTVGCFSTYYVLPMFPSFFNPYLLLQKYIFFQNQIAMNVVNHSSNDKYNSMPSCSNICFSKNILLQK